MEPDTQRNARPIADAPGQDTKPAEHMPMDVFWLCRIFRFLEQFLHSGHTTSFFGSFHAVTYKDMEVPFFVKRRILSDRREPAPPDILQRPGECLKEMQHASITARCKCKVPHYGSDTKFVGAERDPNGDSHKSEESSFT